MKHYLQTTDGNKVRVTSIAYDSKKHLIYASYLAREYTVTAQVGSSLMLGRGIGVVDDYKRNAFYNGSEGFSSVYKRVDMGKDSFIHGISYVSSRRSSTRSFMTRQSLTDIYEGLYHKLMELFDLPLLREWIPYIYESLKGEQLLETIYFEVFDEVDSYLRDYCIVTVDKRLTEEAFDNVVSKLLRLNAISTGVSATGYTPMQTSSIDDFYVKYGQEIVSGLVDDITPLVAKPEATVDSIYLMDKTLFPQQGYIVNGLREVYKRSNVAFMIEEMGCGKTLQGAAVAEAVYVDKYLRNHPYVTVEGAIEKVKYRHFVLCPPHLVSKWAKSIVDDIPLAQVTVLDSFEKVLKLTEKKNHSPEGKEFYVMSKDFGKLSYQYYPAVSWKKKPIEATVCPDCNVERSIYTRSCSHCGSRNEPVDGYKQSEMMICSHCYSPVTINELHGKRPANVTDFQSMKNDNRKCEECGQPLWAPLVNNLGDTKRELSWKRVEVKKSERARTSQTIWVHKDSILGVETKMMMSRKYSPIDLIGKKLGRNFFDLLLVDEAHQYKGSNTAQARAMHVLVNCSKKVLAMTGTLAGGYANHLFYLFWRLIPQRMAEKGFDFTDEMRFTKIYGTIETVYKMDGGRSYNSRSRGSQSSSPKAKPGISPLIYTDFLFDCSVFLSMSDLSAFLPEYNEHVVSVDMDEDIKERYSEIKNRLMSFIQSDNQMGFRMYPTLIQTLLAYPDKPYGFDDIYNPYDTLLIDMSQDEEREIDNLSAKEKRLVKLVNSELEENRNIFVYVEYTGDGDKHVVSRVQAIVERYCGLKDKVAFLKSSSPNAARREEWIQKKAEAGIRLFITNPRCVETGLDFVFERNKVKYNYPTIIFYQLGTNLFTLWQSSKRAYRLSQYEECRTYFMTWRDSLQEEIVLLMGKKKMATSMLQGKFSADGLCSYSGGDVMHQLIGRLKGTISSDGIDSIDKMFKAAQTQKVLSKDEEAYFEAQKKGKKRFGLFAKKKEEEAEVDKETQEVFELLMRVNLNEKLQKTQDLVRKEDQELFELWNMPSATKPTNTKRRKKAVDENQITLF